MFSRILRRRPVVFGVMLAALAFGAACEDDPVIEPEPEVATLRLIFPSLNDTVFVDVGTGTVTSGPITIAANTAFNAQFIKDDGTPETLVTDADFQLNVTPANTGVVTFTRASAFAGTLNKVSAGSTSINFALFHLAEAHNEFDRPVAITVN
jgi:hypothetical protein